MVDTAPWIIDSHTHILPPRLAAKIRGFFNSVISYAPDTPVPCCPPAEAFEKDYSTAESFPPHGKLTYPYHESDPKILGDHFKGVAIGEIWVLPYAHKSGMAEQLNAALLQVCENMRAEGVTAIPGFTVHPSDGADVVGTTTKAALAGGAKVAKLHCSVGSYSVLADGLVPFWKLADEFLFPVVVHVGSSVTGNTASPEVEQMEKLAQTYKRAKIVLAHSASPATKAAIELAQKYRNIYLDTTPTVTRLPNFPPLEHPTHAALLQLAQKGRILYGSDVPNVTMKLEAQQAGLIQIFGTDEDRRRLKEGAKFGELGLQGRGEGDAVGEIFGYAAKRLVAGVRSSTVARL